MKSYQLLFSILIIVTAVNCYIFFNRDDYTYTEQSSYFDLYSKIKNPSINHFETINDSTILIKLNNPSTAPLNWFVRRDSDGVVLSNQAEPVVAIKRGVSTYTIFSNTLQDTLTIKAEYYPKEYYKEFGNKQNGGLLIYKTDLPYNDLFNGTNKWSNYKVAISKSDEDILKSILNDSIQIKQNDNAVEKIKKLAQWLYSKIFKSRGTPTDSMMALPVFEQYKAAVKGNKIMCGNYAQIFNLFANAADVKSRYIEIKQSYGAIPGGVHVFNEFYIPEQKKWAAIDIMFNHLAYIDGAGNFLNAVEVKNTDPANSSVSVLKSSLTDSLISSSFTRLESGFYDLYDPSKNLYYYDDNSMNTIYSFKEKIKRYVTKNNWFEVYSDNSIIDNRAFYIKQLFILLEILLLLLFLFTKILFKKSSNDKN